MGQLVDQVIPSLFNGVTRQPDTVRMPSQVEEGDNALFSVVTGGAEKRPGTEMVAKLNLDLSGKRWVFHGLDHGNGEAYYICVNNLGDVRVFDMNTGAEQTVVGFDASVRAYITSAKPGDDLVLVSIEDYTFIINKTVVVSMLPGNPYAVAGVAKKWDFLPMNRDWPKYGDYVLITNGGLQDDDHYYAWENGAWALKFTGAPPANLTTVAQFRGDGELPTTAAEAEPADGAIWKITNEDGRDDDYFVKWDATAKKWYETANPTQPNAFNAATMPHAVVRDPATGVFTVKRIDWKPRQVGDELTAEKPSFVGHTIQDVASFKARLWLVTADKVVGSASSDYFNFWPEDSTQTLDTDPIDRPANDNKVSDITFAIPFRRSLFLTSSRSQFELASEGFMTPRTAVVDLATNYTTSTRCRPVALGDSLYFAAKSQGLTKVFEYFYDDDTISNTAADITKHVDGYIRGEAVALIPDPVNDALFAKIEGFPSGLFVYKTYWDGTQKVQSAWGKWDIGATDILNVTFVQDYLFMMVDRDGELFIERLSPNRQVRPDDVPFIPLLDARVPLTGVYDVATNRTTWTTPWKHKSAARIVLGPEWAERNGKVLVPRFDTDRTFSVPGNYAAHPVIAGLVYRFRLKLSKQYVRSDQTAIVNGRLQLRSIQFIHMDTGYYEVWITPTARRTKRFKMTGRVLGSAANIVNGFNLESGKFRVPVGSRGDTVAIEIVNETPMPCVITSATWIGFFNQLTGQEGSN